MKLLACEFIIENVTEDWKTKEEVYKQLDKIAGQECLLRMQYFLYIHHKSGKCNKSPG